MIPGNIPVDPNYPEANITFKAPEGTEDWCGDLTVRLTCLSTADGTVGPVGFMSEWYPSPEELELLNAGQPVRTHIVGRNLPPQAVWVRGSLEV